MAMNMISVTGSLKVALDDRISAAKSPGSYRTWTVGKIPWFKFTSNVLQGADATAKPPVVGKTSPFQSLGGGAQTISNLYDKSSRSSPTPGVISATIKHTGTLKTLKKVEVSYKCWGLKQLAELEKLFMSLGKTVVLEYGWSVKPDGTAVTGLLTEKQFGLKFGEFQNAVDKLVDSNGGSYGATKGVVSNFNWTANVDGSYDCTTSFISPAEMMMSQDSQKQEKSGTCCLNEEGEEVNQEDQTKCKKDSDITIKLKSVQKSNVLKNNQAGYKTFGDKKRYWGFSMRMDKEQTTEEKKDRWFFENWVSNCLWTVQKFVSWAYFEEEILNDALMPKGASADSTGNGNSGAATAPGSYRNSDIKAVTRWNTRMTKIANPQKTVSSDPLVCMLPGQNFWDLEGADTAYETRNRVNEFTEMGGLKLMKPFKVNGDNLGWLSHICLNVQFLINCAEESGPTEEFVNKVLDGINSACGNPWDFALSPLPSDPTITTIVDVKALGKNKTPYELSIQGNHTICRSVTLDTEVSNEVKAQVMYGSNAKVDKNSDDVADQDKKAKHPDEFSLFGLGLTDRTPGWNDMTNEVLKQCEEGEGVGERSPDNWEEELKNLQKSYKDAWRSLTNAVDSNTISTMKSTVKALQLFSKYEDVVVNSPPLLPLNFSFKLDGIEGFKWGHSLMIKPIPARYADCSFMVTGVDHDLSVGNWETSISTILRIPPMESTERVLRAGNVKPIATSVAYTFPTGMKA